MEKQMDHTEKRWVIGTIIFWIASIIFLVVVGSCAPTEVPLKGGVNCTYQGVNVCACDLIMDCICDPRAKGHITGFYTFENSVGGACTASISEANVQ